VAATFSKSVGARAAAEKAPPTRTPEKAAV